jgi:hypothetical protein
VRGVVAVILLAGAAHALADSSAADRAAAEAQTRAANNDFVGAAAKYREAFSAEPRPDLMCNVGVAYYKAKDLPRAQRYLEQCLSIGTSLDRGFITNVKKVLTAVETTLTAGSFTPVDLFVQPPTASTSVEGDVVFDEPIVGSRRVWFPFGRYRLTVHAAGHVDRVIEIEAKDRKPVPASVALQRAPAETGSGGSTGSTGSAGGADAGSAAGSAQGSADVGSGSSTITPPPPPPVLARRSVIPPVAASAVSLGAGAAALGFYLAARGSADEAGKATTMTRYTELADRARSQQHMSWAFAAGAGVGALVSGVLWYRYANPPLVEVQASGSGGAVTLGVTW